jgi:hypothetical protein
MTVPLSGRRPGERLHKRKQRTMTLNAKKALLSLLATAPTALAQSCVSLSSSTECPAFGSASISTADPTLRGFLYVENKSLLGMLD